MDDEILARRTILKGALTLTVAASAGVHDAVGASPAGSTRQEL